MAKADEDRSSKPIDPSSLPIIEALAGRLVATVFEYVQLNTVTAKVVHDAVGLMYERTGIPQIEGTNRNDPPAPELDAATTTAATAQEIWTTAGYRFIESEGSESESEGSESGLRRSERICERG